MREFISKIALALTLSFLFANAFAQNESNKLAVYVYGASEAAVNRTLSSKLLSALTYSGNYAEITDPGTFQDDLAKGNITQITPIAQAAKRNGADYVCVVAMTEAFGVYSIYARIIKASDSQVLKTGSTDNALKSMNDLTTASNELARQLLPPGSYVAAPIKFNAEMANSAIANPPSPTTTGAAAPIKFNVSWNESESSIATTAATAATAATGQCAKTYNINELLSKLKDNFPSKLKDCSSKLAKDMALASSPFGKKSAAPEPKSFMSQCAKDGIKNDIPFGFPGTDQILMRVDNFVQNIMNIASAGGTLDPKKLISAVGSMDINGLLSDVKNLASIGCVVDEPYEPIATSANNQATSSSQDGENFSSGERYGTWFLNTLFLIGLGSAGIMNDYVGMGVQASLNIAGVIVIVNSEYNKTKTFGICLLAGSFIYNIARSATYDKPGSVNASNEYAGFNFGFIPNRHGEIMPALMYNKTF